MRKYEITARETDDNGIKYSVAENAPFDSVIIDEENGTVVVHATDEKQHPDKYSTERIVTDLRGLDRCVDGAVKTADMRENLEVSYSTVQNRFGGISEARETAGISTVPDTHSAERILTDLQALDRHVDEIPRTTDIRENLEVSYSTVQNRFGSLQEAREAAGLPQAVDTKHSTERILTDLQALNRHVDGAVRTSAMKENLEVSTSTIQNRFGGIQKAREAAGIPAVADTYTTERILTDLRGLDRHVDGPVRTTDMEKNLEVSATTIIDRFGSIRQARKAAGISTVVDRYPTERILTDLRGLNRYVDGVPRTADMRNHLEVSYSTVQRRFGSIWEAREAAGIPAVTQKDSTERILTDLRCLHRHVDGTVRKADIRENLQCSPGDLQHLFGGIADARDAAGISTQPRYEIDDYTHTSTERILTDLRGLDRSIDGEPSLADMKQTLEVSPGILYERFGGISKAKETARTPAQSPDQPPDQPPDQTQYPTDRILTDLRGLDRHTDSEISSADIKETLEVSINRVYRRFQGIQEAKEAAGIPAVPDTYSTERILTDLQALDRRVDGTVRTADIRENLEVSYTTVRSRFGSIGEARKAAGISGVAQKHSTDRLVTDLKGLDRCVDGAVRTADMEENLEVSATTVATRFGSIQEGREAAGISTVPTQDQQSPTTQHNSDHPEATQQTR